MIGQIVFGILTLGTLIFFGYKAFKVNRNIRLGRPKKISGNVGERLGTTLRVAFGQTKMMVRPVPGILHFFIYFSFLITQIELLEIFIDGASGNHRIVWQTIEHSAISGIYGFTINFIEILSILTLIATIIFLARRNIFKLQRFQKPEMKGWPFKDANIILLGEIYLIICIMLMNSVDLALQGNPGFHHTDTFLVSGFISNLWTGGDPSTLKTLERIGWWGHLAGVLGFLVYLPYSKHFHIMLAFPNVYFSKLGPKGRFNNMPEVTHEVKLMMNPEADPYAVPAEQSPVKFGAKDVKDLNWKYLLDAYSCTECGRCTSECPANITGKKLSPRKIVMDTRDRLEEVSKNIDTKGKDFDDGKSLLGDYITEEELWACTTCNACTEACPVNIDPLGVIIELRRDLVMEQSKAPSALNAMFSNVENNGAPWQFSPTDRGKWAEDLNEELT